ncbi:hypothetical protein BIY24_11310 [Halobacteriovorax marinus]|uniref:DUF7844 domain-containing protein n=1 Tax=Halobacteriovorax marinus TaxID=97084 RepID=UPI000BC3075C|nr:DUF4105 domain-containing protein [Halobacteriovorax marinus]ATH08515.1 hypothetical protein BIY24_11310 [Halobacteriovorax marinus]
MAKIVSTIMLIFFCANLWASEVAGSFISSAHSLLPAKMQFLETEINFKRMNENELNSPCDEEGFIYGKYTEKSDAITLSEQLLDHLHPSEEIQFSCKHRNFYKTALSTLLHEYMHAYEATLDKSERLSNNYEFLALGFWKLKKGNKNRNTYAQRSPNLYEYSSAKEFIAVNFEYFLLDPEYKCRRPNLYKAYEKSLKHSPFKDKQCDSLSDISMSDTQEIDLLNIDPKKIREIHYLFASKGEAMMSRWGHSMFKLVTCDQSWTLEKCRKRGKFVVIGFLAQVADVSINAIKGIFGEYPSDMVITSLDAMKKQYNRAELRDLESIPLDLNQQEKQRFLNHLLRVYWEYSGKYYFFTNNCADEAFKLIQIAKNKEKIYEKNIITPVGIYKYIQENNLSKDYSFNSREENIRNSLLYPSFAKNLDKSFENLSSKYKKTFRQKIKRPNINRAERNFREQYRKIRSISEYSKLPTLKRREIIEEVIKKKDRKNFLDLFAIETQANYVTNNQLLSQMQELASKSKDEEAKEIFAKLVELKNTITFGTSSSESGYGIPQLGDIESVITPEVERATLELREVKEQLQEKYKTIFKNEFIQMEESNFNKTIIKKALRDVL